MDLRISEPDRPTRISEPDHPTEEGATATEYLFLLVLIALAITAGVRMYGTQLGGLFDGAGEQVQTAVANE